ncbi:hypothetical protein HDU99_003017 [Rhizoclosmatium hyalinum]|nr:hypothetical protein HDU99_003017 [Rhizoclosmatium hyalinum]
MIQSNLTLVGSHFERFIQGPPDCSGGDSPVADPTADQLTCLAFSLPSNFSSLSHDIVPNGPFASFMSFTNTSAACGGSDFISRLTTVYNRTVSPSHFVLGANYNNSAGAETDAHFISSVYTNFYLDSVNGTKVPVNPPPNGVKARRGGPGSAICSFSWISTVTQAPGQYFLAYKNPVCGSKAPKIVDTSVETQESFGISYYPPDIGVPQFSSGNISIFAAAYHVDISAVKYVSISDAKFDVIVTSNAAAQSADNSCIYEYLLADRAVVSRNMTLISYDLGSLPASNETTPADGCISGFTTNNLGSFQFTNTSIACGKDAQNRFQRYFSVPVNVNFRYLDLADTIFNVTVVIDSPPDDSRRDGNAATFVFFDKSFIPTTTTSTIAPTSTAVSTFASSSTVSQSASAKASASGSAVVATTAVADAVPTGYAAPTAYAAPPAYGAPTAYGAPAANNLYKGASAGKVGIISALVVALALAF